MEQTIMIVDDFENIRNMLCETIERKGYQTLKASNGEEGFKKAKADAANIDLIVSDYNMPVKNGMDMLSQLKKDPQTRDIPVIFLTTEKDPEKMKAAKKEGLTSWVQKPYDINHFFSEIEHAIQKKNQNA